MRKCGDSRAIITAKLSLIVQTINGKDADEGEDESSLEQSSGSGEVKSGRSFG